MLECVYTCYIELLLFVDSPGEITEEMLYQLDAIRCRCSKGHCRSQSRHFVCSSGS